MRWHIKYVNDIESNPVESEYCIVDTGDGTGRMYRIQPMRKADYTGLVKEAEEYKYFIFFESRVKKIERMETLAYGYNHYSGYEKEDEGLIQVYDTMEEAKKRAWTQYEHMFGYVLSYLVDNTKEVTNEHFCV